MNRRESLQTLGFTALSTGLILEACNSNPETPVVIQKENLDTIGRQEFEVERLKKLYAEPPFFNDHEMQTICVLVDIIIPKDEISGSASDAKVPEFIAFIVKDMPEHQVPLRGGLKWLDVHCLHQYDRSFIDCDSEQQLKVIEKIAYPLKAKPEMQPGVVFFNRLRNLTASGFFTSKMGVEDLGYVGNRPNRWEGVPQDVLIQYDMQND